MRNAKGFTLIELLVVIVILSILGTYVGVKLMNRPDEARQTQARTQIGALENALKMYRLDSGSYPSQEQGLKALVEKPTTGTVPRNWRAGGYLDKNRLPKDPWGSDFIYVNPGIHNPTGVDVISYGADGQPGGSDFDADLGNWDESEAQTKP